MKKESNSVHLQWTNLHANCINIFSLLSKTYKLNGIVRCYRMCICARVSLMHPCRAKYFPFISLGFCMLQTNIENVAMPACLAFAVVTKICAKKRRNVNSNQSFCVKDFHFASIACISRNGCQQCRYCNRFGLCESELLCVMSSFGSCWLIHGLISLKRKWTERYYCIFFENKMQCISRKTLIISATKGCCRISLSADVRMENRHSRPPWKLHIAH